MLRLFNCVILVLIVFICGIPLHCPLLILIFFFSITSWDMSCMGKFCDYIWDRDPLLLHFNWIYCISLLEIIYIGLHSLLCCLHMKAPLLLPFSLHCVWFFSFWICLQCFAVHLHSTWCALHIISALIAHECFYWIALLPSLLDV